MNQTPPDRDEPDDVGDEYRRASALDPSRPGEAVRRAVLDHAAKLAADRAVRRGSIGAKAKRPASNHTRWRPAFFGSLAAAAFAGLLIAPHFLGPRPPPVPAVAGAQKARPSEGAGPRPQTSAAKQAPSAEQALAARNAPAVRQAPAVGQARSTLTEQPLVAEADRAMKAEAGAARDASAPMPQQSRPVDPSAALRRAAEIGDELELTARLDAPHDIDARDARGRTALMLAILHGHASAVEVLLARGADPNAADTRGTTPLQSAVAGGQPAIISLLQHAGAR
jgi:hypothetical protein